MFLYESTEPNASPDTRCQAAPPPPRGEGLIKVAGTLLIVFGAIALLIYASALAKPWEWLIGEGFFLVAPSTGFEISVAYTAFRLFGLLTAAGFLAFGVFGVINAGKRRKRRASSSWESSYARSSRSMRSSRTT